MLKKHGRSLNPGYLAEGWHPLFVFIDGDDRFCVIHLSNEC